MKMGLEKSDRIESPRESMRVLPDWMQPFLTELTGMPLHDEEMPFRWTWWMRLALAWVILMGSLTVSVLLVAAGPAFWLLLPFSWLFTVSAVRAFQTSFVHHASHGNLSGNESWDNFLGELMSTIAWIMPLRDYKEEHIKGHHPRNGLLDGNGADDPDLWFIVNYMEFKPGRSRRVYWMQLMWLLVSPVFHWRFFHARTRANLTTATWKRRTVAVAYAGMLLTLTAWTSSWTMLLFVVLIPGIWLYQVSGVLQVLTEHTWVRDTSGKLSKREVLVRLTYGRFLGCRTPDSNLPPLKRYVAWMAWWSKMLLVYLPLRLFMLMGDLPQHDLHHVLPMSDPANAAYQRREAVRKAKAANLDTGAYLEVWGFRAMLNMTFDALASIGRNSELGKPLTYKQRNEIMLGM
jgi:hypothetical protein